MPGRKQDRRQLRPEQTVLLTSKQHQGLNHVYRRRILRALHVSDRPLSPTQLSGPHGALSEVALSTVSYHMNVLVKNGLVRERDAKPRRGATEHFFGSKVMNELPVISVLAETEELDSEKRDGGGGD